MSNEIKLNFYDETIVIANPKTYNSFKSEIARLYAIDPSDVDELIVYYFDGDKAKIFIRHENDFNSMLSLLKKMQIIIFIEIHEESKLFKKGDIGNKLDPEKLRLEILEKEKLLKEAIEKEKLELQKKKEDAKRKVDDENKKKRLDELRKKKLLLEKEDELRRLREKQELEAEVSKLMNENIEKFKASIINSTVNQSINLVDKQLEKRNLVSQCKEVHQGFSCTSCSMNPIVGFRYTCGITPDFNLCDTCEGFVGDSHPYPLLKIRNSQQGKLKLKFMVEGGKKDEKKTTTNIKDDDDCITFENLMKKK